MHEKQQENLVELCFEGRGKISRKEIRKKKGAY